MNIFFLDRCPRKCAEYHCDKHATKMVLESAQMLSTAHHELDSNPHPDLYKKAHLNHPSTIWVRSTVDQYIWTYRLFSCLSSEYTLRYKKIHKSWQVLGKALQETPDGLTKRGWSDPPQCMPDSIKSNDTVEAYRMYYKIEKGYFAKWRIKEPHWYLKS